MLTLTSAVGSSGRMRSRLVRLGSAPSSRTSIAPATCQQSLSTVPGVAPDMHGPDECVIRRLSAGRRLSLSCRIEDVGINCVIPLGARFVLAPR